jgi:hypothetical protein
VKTRFLWKRAKTVLEGMGGAGFLEDGLDMVGEDFLDDGGGGEFREVGDGADDGAMDFFGDFDFVWVELVMGVTGFEPDGGFEGLEDFTDISGIE